MSVVLRWSNDDRGGHPRHPHKRRNHRVCQFDGKAQLIEAFSFADGIKAEVAEYTQTGSCPTPGANGIPAAMSYSGNYVASVDIPHWWWLRDHRVNAKQHCGA